MFTIRRAGLTALTAALLVGCQSRAGLWKTPSPAEAGLNTRDLLDVPAQADAEDLAGLADLTKAAEAARLKRGAASTAVPRNVLCLSGGGSYGAYSAGVLVGMTRCGCRPQFDVVTGISTGALIAPFAFLGPQYDGEVERFYTTLKNDDIYKMQVVRGLVSSSLASNAPLAKQLDQTLTPEIMAEIACEHQKGRRLYVGTTELEGKRFVVWDIGAIACRGDRELIKKILLGSAAIPGFFPPSEIGVNVDGRCLVEKHVDGGVSQALFFRPPYVPPEQRRQAAAADMAGTNVYAIVAGKIYADPEVMKMRALTIAGKCVSTIIYAQTRGDLQRLWTLSVLTGMNLNIAAIPAEFAAPNDCTEFDPVDLRRMFDEGVRQVCCGTAWRKTPPGVEPGESPQERTGTCLTRVPRGPETPVGHPKKAFGSVPRTEQGMPVAYPPVVR
jgi:hypothetical protein